MVVITNCSVDEAIRREGLRKPSFEEKDRNFLSGKFTPHHHGAGFSQSDFAKRKDIHANYEKVKKFLEGKRLNVIYLNTDNMDISKACRKIVNFIQHLSKAPRL